MKVEARVCQRRAKSPREERAAAVKMAKRGRGLREDETEETTQTSETLSAAATQTASQPPILLQGEPDALRSGCPSSIQCDSNRILTPPVLPFVCLVDPFLSLTRAAF